MFSSYGSVDDDKRQAETNALLEDSIAVTEESHQIGNATYLQLQGQRAQIEAANERAGETRTITQRARQVMKNIEFKVFKEKLTLWLIILFLLGVDGGLAYLLAKNDGSFTGKK
mmetsp:Transcript_9213/g.12761  ORF Transcript_9213/g.12761 Transcript_9213/m.12761 type:complete len:114 (+) Transcript_9213:34-375(+)